MATSVYYLLSFHPYDSIPSSTELPDRLLRLRSNKPGTLVLLKPPLHFDTEKEHPLPIVGTIEIVKTHTLRPFIFTSHEEEGSLTPYEITMMTLKIENIVQISFHNTTNLEISKTQMLSIKAITRKPGIDLSVAV
jgi:hypothetical protein